MESSKCVCVSGYLMSSLLYEHSSSDSDQEGFLIGDVVVHQTETINDNQISLKKEETVINIYSHVPCEDVYSFYTCAGNIEMEKLDFYLKDKQKDVVGWYRFRRHTPLTMSLREKTVHRNLNLALCHSRKMVFGLFSTSVSNNLATHTFDHIFYTCNLSASSGSILFDQVPLNIVNLEDSAYDEYRLHPRAPVNTKCGIYKDVVSSSRSLQFFTLGFRGLSRLEEQLPESVILSEDINTALMDKIEGLIEQVGGSEAEIGSIALDIKELQEKIARSLCKGLQIPVRPAGSHSTQNILSSRLSSPEIEKESNVMSGPSCHSIGRDDISEDKMYKYGSKMFASARTRSFSPLKRDSLSENDSKSATC